MKKAKLFVEFKRVNIEIKSEDGKVNCGIPYCFEPKYGETNLKYFLEHLGFDVEIKEKTSTGSALKRRRE